MVTPRWSAAEVLSTATPGRDSQIRKVVPVTALPRSRRMAPRQAGSIPTSRNRPGSFDPHTVRITGAIGGCPVS